MCTPHLCYFPLSAFFTIACVHRGQCVGEGGVSITHVRLRNPIYSFDTTHGVTERNLPPPTENLRREAISLGLPWHRAPERPPDSFTDHGFWHQIYCLRWNNPAAGTPSRWPDYFHRAEFIFNLQSITVCSGVAVITEYISFINLTFGGRPLLVNLPFMIQSDKA